MYPPWARFLLMGVLFIVLPVALLAQRPELQGQQIPQYQCGEEPYENPPVPGGGTVVWRQCFYRYLATGIRLAVQTGRFQGVAPSCLAEMAANRERVAQLWAGFSGDRDYQRIWDAQGVRESCIGQGTYDADAAMREACPNGRFTMGNRGLVNCVPAPPERTSVADRPAVSPPVRATQPPPAERPPATPPNVRRMANGTFEPARGYEWLSNDGNDLRVRLKKGLRRGAGGTLEPAEGYEWALPNEEGSDSVRPAEKRARDYLAPDHWTEPWLNGSVVRLRNRDSRPIVIMASRLFDCKNTGKLLCPVTQAAPYDYWLFSLEPGQIQDLAIVPWPEESGKPMSFRYAFEWKPKP